MSTTDSGRVSVPAQTGAAPAAPTVIDQDAPQPAAGRTRTDSVRDAIQVGACLLSGVLVSVGFLLDPAKDSDTGAETIAAVAASTERFYWSNTMTAIGLAMIAAVGLAVLRLVRGRGRVLGTIGGLLLILGGTAAGAGIFMYGAVLSSMVESDVDPAVLAQLQDHIGESMRPGLAFLLGFVPLLLGLVLSGIALLVSRAAHPAVPVLLILGAVSIMVLGDTAASPLSDLVMTLGLAGVGLTLWQRTLGARTA